MRAIVFSSQYKKDLSRAAKRKLPTEELDQIVWMLASDKVLPEKNRDHALSGPFAGCRECHIQPDWLLIYRKSSAENVELLSLIRTGTHDDLFGRTRR